MDNITQKYFSAACHVTYDPSVQGGVRSVFDAHVAKGITGALGGSDILITQSPSSVHFKVSHLFLDDDMEREIVQGEDGLSLVQNVSFMLKQQYQRQGIAVRSFAIEVREARRLGFAYILTEAAGSASSRLFNGYYTWPRLGYDAELSSIEKAGLPKALKRARTVLDLMSTPLGRQWWSSNGTCRIMRFDLAARSRSNKVLKQYMKLRGVCI